MSEIYSIDSITQVHKALGLAPPKHPLVSIIDAKEIKSTSEYEDVKLVMNLYQVALKKSVSGKLKYGRTSYDFQEGTLVFTGPGQTLKYEAGETNIDDLEGWSLIFHPDLITKSELGEKIGEFSFFEYNTNEALHLSNEEQNTLEELLDKIIKEYSQNMDKHSHKLITSNIEMILNYCVRFYDRQFYTRTNLNSDFISKFERKLKEYYQKDLAVLEGTPNLKYFSNELGLSPNYLSDVLKKETGKSAKEHIQLYIINKAKNRLLNSNDSISEIAFSLGFEYPQHFSSLFKSKTGQSPKDFRILN